MNSATALVITGPANGAAFSLFSTVTVTGTFEGPTNSTILVDNEEVTRLAAISGNTFTATFEAYEFSRMAPGNNTLTARLNRPDGTTATRSITVVAHDAPVVAFTSPVCNVFTAPANILLAVDAKVPGGAVSRVEFYRGSILLATVTAPPYQFNWTNVAAGSYSILAKTYSDRGLVEQQTSIIVTVLGPNTLPSISITSPTNGATFTAPANIPITVSATDLDGTVKQVEYFANASPIGVTNVPPFSMTWSNVAAGSYALTARATDDRNGQTTSAPVNITVAPPNQPPTVSLTAPANGASFTVGANVTVSATASDPDGTINRVEFYTGSTLIGTTTNAPHSVIWTAMTPGANTLTAKAFDNLNANTVSAPVNVTITGAITYLHNDFAGNPIAATDASGAILWKENFRPYGDRLNNQPAASGNRQWFHGKAVDADTGLSYFGARYYDPTLGRFMGMDPASFTEKNLHSFNRYAYGNNNPYKFVDPDGKEPVGVIVKLLEKGGEKVIRWISSKAAAVMARKQGETVVMKTRQQAKQVEEAFNEGNKLNITRHKGHTLEDGSKGHPHYQTEGKEGHSMWGKIGGGAGAAAAGVSPNDAGANNQPSSSDGTTWTHVGNFMMDLLVPGGVGDVGKGSDIVPRPRPND